VPSRREQVYIGIAASAAFALIVAFLQIVLGLGVIAIIGTAAFALLYGGFLLVARGFTLKTPRLTPLGPAVVIPADDDKRATEHRLDDLHADNQGRIGAMRRALIEAKEEEARKPQIHIRVDRDREETGNTASEPYRRWLHLKVENWNETPARGARVNVRTRTNTDRGAWREWFWTDARQVMDIARGSPVAIPIALGDIAEPSRPSGVAALLYHHEHYKVGNWFLTPQGHMALMPVASGRYWLDVEVKWSDQSATDCFILDLPERAAKREAELIHTVGKDQY
jgi:hypothetical protein